MKAGNTTRLGLVFEMVECICKVSMWGKVAADSREYKVSDLCAVQLSYPGNSLIAVN